MADNIELYDYWNTRTMKHLQDKATGEDKARDQRGINRLLELSKFRPQPAPSHTDPLTNEMLKGLDNGR